MNARLDSVAAIVLAAGKGTRMKSETPKVLHRLSGLPMIGHVIKTIKSLGLPHICAVIGGDTARLQSYLQNLGPISLTVQTARLGTGEAVACAGYGFRATPIPAYARGHALSGPQLDSSHLLICAGDTPALESSVLREFLNFCFERQSRLAVLAMDHPEPFGYGRIVSDAKGQLEAIVEEKDATPAQKKLTICNSGVIFAERAYLFELLAALQPNNAQKEYYLTDCFQLARQAGRAADVFITSDFAAFDGINDRLQLAQVEARLQRRLKESWMRAGVTFRLPETSYIEESVILDGDTEIGPSCSLLGTTRIGKGCEIGSHAVLKNVIIPDHTHVPAGTLSLHPDL